MVHHAAPRAISCPLQRLNLLDSTTNMPFLPHQESLDQYTLGSALVEIGLREYPGQVPEIHVWHGG